MPLVVKLRIQLKIQYHQAGKRLQEQNSGSAAELILCSIELHKIFQAGNSCITNCNSLDEDLFSHPDRLDRQLPAVPKFVTELM